MISVGDTVELLAPARTEDDLWLPCGSVGRVVRVWENYCEVDVAGPVRGVVATGVASVLGILPD